MAINEIVFQSFGDIVGKMCGNEFIFIRVRIMTNEKPGARPAVKTFQMFKLFGFFCACLFPPRLLDDEVAKRSELERLHQRQQKVLSQTEAEKQELVAVREAKERELSTAMEQLDRLEKEQQGALQQFEVRRLSFRGN